MVRVRTAPRRAPRQKRAEDTVDVLLEATERAMVKHGFDGATTNRIAETAGVSIGTLYHYFPSKEALVEALVHRVWKDEFEAMRAASAALSEAPLPEAIRAIVGAMVACVARRAGLYARWYAEAPHMGRDDLGRELVVRAEELVLAKLKQHASELHPTDLVFAADLVVTVAQHAIRRAARISRVQMTSGILAEELSQMLERYLVKPGVR